MDTKWRNESWVSIRLIFTDITFLDALHDYGIGYYK